MFRGFEGATPFLKRFFPNRSDVFYFRADVVVTVAAGSVLGLVVFQPANYFAAVAAGTGWVGTLNTFTKQHPEPTGAGV